MKCKDLISIVQCCPCQNRVCYGYRIFRNAYYLGNRAGVHNPTFNCLNFGGEISVASLSQNYSRKKNN